MEQELRFRMDFGMLAVLKKNWADYEQLLREIFYVFIDKFILYVLFYLFCGQASPSPIDESKC